MWPEYLTGQQTGSMFGTKTPCLDPAGWLQLGSSASCLGAVARLRLLPGWGPDPYHSSTGLAFPWSRWGHVPIVIQEDRCLAAGTKHRSCLVSRCEVTWPSVVCRVRERGECQTAAVRECCRSQISWRWRRHTLQAAATRPCPVKKLYCGKGSFKDLEPMYIFSLAICRGAKLSTA